MLEIHKEEVTMPCIYLAGCCRESGGRIPNEFKHSMLETGKRRRAEERSSEEEWKPVTGERGSTFTW